MRKENKDPFDRIREILNAGGFVYTVAILEGDAEVFSNGKPALIEQVLVEALRKHRERHPELRQ